MSEEKYDVLDEDGNKTGKVLTKSQVHEQELWHASSFVWVYNSKGEVLLQFRAKDKKVFPNIWDVSVAGHISAGETPLDAAVREVEEEIGTKVLATELTEITLTNDIVPWLPNKKHPEYCWIYILQKDVDIKKLTIQKEELTEIKWISIKELINDLKDPKKSKKYSNRNIEVYRSGLNAIIQNLGKNWGEL